MPRQRQGTRPRQQVPHGSPLGEFPPGCDHRIARMPSPQRLGCRSDGVSHSPSGRGIIEATLAIRLARRAPGSPWCSAPPSGACVLRQINPPHRRDSRALATFGSDVGGTGPIWRRFPSYLRPWTDPPAACGAGLQHLWTPAWGGRQEDSWFSPRSPGRQPPDRNLEADTHRLLARVARTEPGVRHVRNRDERSRSLRQLIGELELGAELERRAQFLAGTPHVDARSE